MEVEILTSDYSISLENLINDFLKSDKGINIISIDYSVSHSGTVGLCNIYSALIMYKKQDKTVV